MTLVEKIKTIYPELTAADFAFGYITLQNDLDAKGDYISKWEHPTLAQPTKEQLEAIE